MDDSDGSVGTEEHETVEIALSMVAGFSAAALSNCAIHPGYGLAIFAEQNQGGYKGLLGLGSQATELGSKGSWELSGRP